MNGKVVVTGGAGFIGSHVTDIFVENGFDVLVIDNLSHGKVENVNQKADFVQADIRNIESVREILKSFQPKIVCHLAAHVSVIESIDDPLNDASINVMGTIVVAEESFKVGAEKIVFASSAAVYGNLQKLPALEDFELKPVSPYGVSKKAAEEFIRVISKNYKKSFCVLRLSNVYGSRQQFDEKSGAIPVFIEACARGKKVNLYGYGKMVRDFVYVEDVARAFLVVATKGEGIFNISSGIGTEINQVFELTRKELNGEEPNLFPAREGEIEKIVMDSTKAFRELGWKSTVSIEEGIKRTIKYYLQDVKGEG